VSGTGATARPGPPGLTGAPPRPNPRTGKTRWWNSARKRPRCGTGGRGTGHRGRRSRRPSGTAYPAGRADQHAGFVARWREIQAGFVDEPGKAVQEADALVTDLMRRLAAALATECEQLESRMEASGDVSTEDLRLGLRSYRSVFGRLLAAWQPKPAAARGRRLKLRTTARRLRGT